MVFCGNSSVVEHNLAKVGVAGSNPVSRSICSRSGPEGGPDPVDLCGGVAKWLRRRSAKPLFSGSNPLAASIAGGAGVAGAGVAELGDAADLKSAGPAGPWGFDSLPRHQQRGEPQRGRSSTERPG